METNALTIFEHKDFGKIRTLVVDGVPWAVAKDVATALGYADTKQAVKLNCKKAQPMPVDAMGGVRTPPIIIGESDMYRLIMRSKLPSAEAFQDWVCEEVLPSLRKTGSYSITGQPANELELIALRQRLNLAYAEQGRALGLVGTPYVQRVFEHGTAIINGEEPQGERQLDVSAFLTGKGFGTGLLRHHASKFGKVLKKAYIRKHGAPPEKGWRRVDGADRLVFCYFERDTDLFEATFEDMFGGGIPRLVTR